MGGEAAEADAGERQRVRAFDLRPEGLAREERVRGS